MTPNCVNNTFIALSMYAAEMIELSPDSNEATIAVAKPFNRYIFQSPLDPPCGSWFTVGLWSLWVILYVAWLALQILFKYLSGPPVKPHAIFRSTQIDTFWFLNRAGCQTPSYLAYMCCKRVLYAVRLVFVCTILSTHPCPSYFFVNWWAIHIICSTKNFIQRLVG